MMSKVNYFMQAQGLMIRRDILVSFVNSGFYERGPFQLTPFESFPLSLAYQDNRKK